MATLSSIRSAAIEDTGFSSGLDSAQVTAIAGGVGLSVYSTLDNLPTSGLTSGDQAFVSSTNRFYISNGSGWYNVALVNATPTLVVSPTGTVALAIDGSTPTVITLTATDSDNADASLTYSVESDGSFANIATISQDSSVFTITPLSEDSATPGSSTLTFKASDGISFGSGTTTFTLTFITTIENSNYTTLLAKADTAGTDNQVDASTNNHTITENGNVTSTALSPYHPGGYSTYFDGTGDYLSGNDMGLGGAGAFTVEAWMYPTVYNTYANDIYSHGANLSVGADFLAFGLKSDGNVQMFKGSGSPALLSTSAPCATLNQWYHVAFVRESNNNTSAYVNGVLVAGPTSISGNLTSAPSGRAFIGTQSYSAGDVNRSFEGYMTDVRIVTDAVYTSAFTPPTERLTAIANTSLLTCHAPYIADGSTNNHTITVNGNTSTKRFGPYDYNPYTEAEFGGSVYFNGVSGTKLTIPVSASLQKQAGGDFTFEAWIYPIARTSYDMIVTCGDQGADFGYTFFWHVTSYHLMFEAGTSGWASTPYTSSSNDGIIRLNEWQHVAFMYSGGNLTLFRNGKVALYQASAQLPQIATSGLFALGGYMDGGVQHPFKGYMANARVTQSAVYTSNTNFTPPTAPLTTISGTTLLTCTNKNDIWEQGSGSLLTKVGNATSSDTQRKFTSSSAMYFDGTGDYLNTNSNNLLALGTGDFTVECWVNKSDTNHRGIFQISPTSGGLDTNYTVTLGFAWGNSTAWQIYAGGGATNGSTFSLSTNTWYHAALVRSSGTTKLYIDGTEEISISDTQNYTGAYMAIGGYYSTTYVHNGYIQDLRVTKGLARYTSNFTPPTAEFDG